MRTTSGDPTANLPEMKAEQKCAVVMRLQSIRAVSELTVAYRYPLDESNNKGPHTIVAPLNLRTASPFFLSCLGFQDLECGGDALTQARTCATRINKPLSHIIEMT